VRSHVKASSAVSTERRAKWPVCALAALSVCALVALTASVASGAVTTEYVGSFGPDGTEATDFEWATGVAVDQGTGAVYVLDGRAGVLHKFNAKGEPLDFTGTDPDISGNEISGLDPNSFNLNEAQVAVDSTSHVVYVTEKESVKAFQADGEPAVFSAGPGAGTNEIPAPVGLSVNGVTVDANGSIYVSTLDTSDPFTENETPGTVAVYASTGASLTSFTAIGPRNLAVAPDGAVYVTNRSGEPHGGTYKFIPSEFPVTATTTYTTGPVLKTPSAASTDGVAVDPATGDLYVLRTGTASDAGLLKYDSSGAFVRRFGGSQQEGELGFFPQGIAIVGDGEEFQFYVGDRDAGLNPYSKVKIWGEEINPGPPSIESTSAAEVTSTSATLRTRINPNTFATTYRFEYGLGDCEVSACTSVPLSAVGIGAGHHPVKASQHVAGLQAGTTYHYRVIAENSEGIVEGPDHTFTTQVSGLGFALPDDRAWEMVSPPNKTGGSLVMPSGGIVQAAEDGEGIAYLSVGSIEADPDGSRSPLLTSVLGRRTAAGWHSKDISRTHTEATSASDQASDQRIFTPDLSRALVETRDDTLLSPQASERTPYVAENTEPPTYTPLVTGKEGFANVPPGTVFGGEDVLEPMGANPALTDVVFRSSVPLVPGASGTGLYRWSAGQIQPVSELPVSEGGGVATGLLGSKQGSVRNAVSDDGSRVFWGAGGDYNTTGINMTALYLRDTAAEASIRLDVLQPGASGAGEAHPAFQGASADGTVVFFTDSRDLTVDSSLAGRDLYRCEIPFGASAAGCTSLVNLSAASGESAMVKDQALAFGEDGSRIYFVAEGVLDTAANEEGDEALASEPNIYLWEEGEGVRFIATLSPADGRNWGASSANGYSGQISAAASPSGRYLTFMSELSLTGADNHEAASDEPVEQAFRYDAQSGEIVCVSCNPNGASPNGQELGGGQMVDRAGLWSGRWVAAVLPEPTNKAEDPSLYRPRSVLDNGRVFFNAIDSLVPADSNGEWDVYQYESTGVGDCTVSSGGASTTRSEGGCVSLLSSGTAEEAAAFLDASASGDDVFFLTPAKLSVTDFDTELDVYDARVNGVPAVLEPSNECLGEACQPAAAVPNDPTPASAGFRGQGDPKPNARKRCAKGKRLVRRKGKARCVVRKQSRKGKAAKRRGKASKGRRANP
jgi:sugar lactone lactonase YvrE